MLRNWLRAHPDDHPVAAALRPGAARLGLLGAALLLVSVAVRLAFQLQSFVEPGEPVTRELVQLVIGETAWGRGWLMQFGAGMAAMGGYLAAILVPGPGWIGAGVGAGLVAAAAPLTGHALSEVAGRSGILLDALHVVGGSAWLGTLLVTVAAGLAPLARLEPGPRAVLVARLVTAFSPVALVGSGLAVAAGVVLGWRYLDGSPALLFGTDYGRALLFKLAALAGVAGLGAWNWRVLLPRLGTPPATGALGRSARIELLLGLLLLAITAVLVALPMPAEGIESQVRQRSTPPTEVRT